MKDYASLALDFVVVVYRIDHDGENQVKQFRIHRGYYADLEAWIDQCDLRFGPSVMPHYRMVMLPFRDVA